MPNQSGDLAQIDSVQVFSNGVKHYLINAIDLKSRFAFSYSYSSLSSAAAKDFITKFRRVAPFELKRIQTDNGSEFEKHFSHYVEKEKITHFHIYPRHPQLNGHIERFNRTIQEQYVEPHVYEIDDTDAFNRKLMDYLLWYNTEKPHQGINKMTPLDSLLRKK